MFVFLMLHMLTLLIIHMPHMLTLLMIYMPTHIKHDILTHIMLNMPHAISMLMFHIHIMHLCMVEFILAPIVAGMVTKLSFSLIALMFQMIMFGFEELTL